MGRDPVIGSMSRPEFTGAGAVFAPLRLLPPGLRLAALAGLLVLAMVSCTALVVTRPGPPPGENVCRAHSYVPEREPCLVPGAGQ